jgi:SulP family sulfate permease
MTGLDAIVEPLGPLRDTLRSYDRQKLRADAFAALTVAAVEVPQAMAYAVVAGVPPQYGLYTSVVHGAVAALFASNAHLATGPTNTQSLLVASVVSRAVAEVRGESDPALYLQLVFGLTLLKGLLQLAFAAARMGSLLRYVSHSVIVGFSAGAGVLIAAGQLPSFLGLDVDADPTRAGVLAMLGPVLEALPDADARAIGIAVGSLAILFALRRWTPRAPAALVALAAGAFVAWITGWSGSGLRVVGEIPHALPGVVVPLLEWRDIERLLGGALALAALGAIETVSIGKASAARTGARIEANRELLAQGIASTVGAFLQNVSGSASFTRSALNEAAGGRTRLASVYSSAFVAASLVLLAPLASSIPLASLAAILFGVAYQLVDVRFVVRALRTVRSDAVVCIATLVSALLAPLHYAIFLGIFLNVALYLRKASRLHMTEMRGVEGGAFEEHPFRDAFGRERIAFLQIEGELFFGLADELRDQLARIVRSGVPVVVLRLKRTHSFDATALLALEEFARAMRAQGRHVLFCGLTPELARAIHRFGLAAIVGEENLFETGPHVFGSAQRALARARELVGTPVESDAAIRDDEAAADRDAAADRGTTMD